MTKKDYNPYKRYAKAERRKSSVKGIETTGAYYVTVGRNTKRERLKRKLNSLNSKARNPKTRKKFMKILRDLKKF